MDYNEVMQRDAGEISSEADESSKKQMHINDMPHEILLTLFSYLSTRDLCERVPHVCSHWRMVVNDPLFLQNFKLVLSRCHHKEYICNVISGLYNVGVLHISDADDTNMILCEASKKCKNLRRLSLTNLRGSNIQPNFLYDLARNNSNITVLHIDAAFLTVDGLIMIIYFENLKELRVWGFFPIRSQNSGPYIRNIIDHCKNLSELYIPRYGHILDEDLIYIIDKRRQKLTGLEMSSYRLSDFGLRNLELCQHLKRLELFGCDNMGIESLSSIAKLKLEHLSLSQIRERSSVQVNRFLMSENFGGLLYLDLRYIENLNDDSLRTIALRCPLLEFLRINSSLCITNSGIEAIVTKCTQLKSLFLVNLANISGTFLSLVPSHLTTLGTLGILCCPTISKQDINFLKSSFPQLKIEHDKIETIML